MNIINKLNNYNWNDEEIEKVKQYILNRVVPAFKTNFQRDRFIEKYKHFVVENNKLVYKPLNLEVIPNDKRDETLKAFYDDLKAVGAGKTSFYKKISSNYLNINRAYCSDFISKQSTHQMNTEHKHISNKPILASACGERLAVDLVNVSNLAKYNEGNHHILTAIDYFSRKVWARPLKNKYKETVLDGLKSIFDEMTIKPHIIQSDNGSEFKNYYTINWYKENDIQHIFTLAYAPESNGLIENFNKQLRKMMREIFIRTNSLNWLDYLQICCDNKNTQYNSTTKQAPNKLWNPDSFYDRVKNKTRELPKSLAESGATPEAIRINARNNIKEKAKKQIERNTITELVKGDLVRVKMSALYSQIRKEIKAGNKKLINVSYTPEIYKIFKVIDEIHPGYERKRYTLRNLDNTPLLTESKVNEMRKTHRYRRLFASDLLKVDEETKNVNYDNDRAKQLNLIEKLVVEPKPKVIKQKKVKEIIMEEPEEPKELKRSGRIRKENREKDFVY